MSYGYACGVDEHAVWFFDCYIQGGTYRSQAQIVPMERGLSLRADPGGQERCLDWRNEEVLWFVQN